MEDVETPRVAIKIDSLIKNYGLVTAVDDLSIEINKGEIYGLLGPNGAGKSTILKIIVGMLKPAKGSVVVLGKNPQNQPDEVKSIVGYVPEEITVPRSLTPKNLFKFIASIRKIESRLAKQRLLELLEIFDARMYLNVPISTLSKGNQQKIQITSALFHDPEILVLDEPLTSLDAKTRNIVKKILEIEKNRGRTIVLSTHVIEEVTTICDRIGVIDNGKLVTEDSMDQVRESAKKSGITVEDYLLNLMIDINKVGVAITKFKDLMA